MGKPNTVFMTRHNMDNLPIGLLPQGYTSRTFQDGDEEGWTKCLNVLFPTWTVEGVRETIVKTPEFREEYTYLLIYNNTEIVGCIGYWYTNPDIVNKKHFVPSLAAILPEHQGKGMMFTLLSRLLHIFRENGFTSASLNTQDDRPAAIKTYLKLGFEPIIRNKDDVLIWGKLLHILTQHIKV